MIHLIFIVFERYPIYKKYQLVLTKETISVQMCTVLKFKQLHNNHKVYIKLDCKPLENRS